MITAKNLIKYYGAHAAVDDISFEIERGEVVGLLGLNGAGKTTTLRILSGLLVPTSGSVTIAGHDMATQPESVRAQIGFLPETPPLYPEMTIEGFLTFVARINGVTEKDLPSALERALQAADLIERRHSVIDTLSHGYRRRVGIAHAIVHRPSLILLDEPTSGLDPAQIVQMRKLIRSLGERHTVIVSSHVLTEIRQMCDRILVLQDGRIVAEGTEADLGLRVDGITSLHIEVRGPRQTLVDTLSGAAKVVRHTIERDEDGIVQATVELESDAPELLSEVLVNSGLGLRKLTRANLELESIFLKLTTGEKTHQPNQGEDHA